MLNTFSSRVFPCGDRELSRYKGEPEWMLQLRLHAWETYENTPAPLGRRGDLGTLKAMASFDFQNCARLLRPKGPRFAGGCAAIIASFAGE